LLRNSGGCERLGIGTALDVVPDEVEEEVEDEGFD
jgi:hypothetical protein